MTLSHLIENLQELDDELDDELAAVPSSSVQHLYDQLPDRFRFATFFRRADEAGWEAAQARHFLVRCLADERLVQAGAYLEKTGKGE